MTFMSFKRETNRPDTKKLMGGLMPWMCGVGVGAAVEPCEGTWETADVQAETEMERTFGMPSTQCPSDLLGSGATSDGAVAAWNIAGPLLALATGFLAL